ncbi:hypothetical protein RND71_014734 [Anisodus tanguticus]|uniref:F-box domain-containing protein n=1 Tax=Anisodus tanguticus TaxID=243964 RepID=A0AAE1S9P4_9SOLA|nr:hypothetical protein RND71_014734 [Anisodus tanguticus]
MAIVSNYNEQHNKPLIVICISKTFLHRLESDIYKSGSLITDVNVVVRVLKDKLEIEDRKRKYKVQGSPGKPDKNFKEDVPAVAKMMRLKRRRKGHQGDIVGIEATPAVLDLITKKLLKNCHCGTKIYDEKYKSGTNKEVDRDREIVVEVVKERISALPRDVIHYILELFPVEVAARTSILSKKWRYVWSMLPVLVLDSRFCKNLAVQSQYNNNNNNNPVKSHNVVVQSLSFFKQTIDEILLHHLGDIVKFDLHVPAALLSSYADVDRWMLYVTRNGVKKLTLDMPDSNTYKLPSCNLKTLHLEGITFEQTTKFCIINAPLLITLDVLDCDGTQYLNIVSPLLELLSVHNIYYLALNYFMNCKKLRELHLGFDKAVDNLEYDERSTLIKLLFNLAPTLERLNLDLFFLELFSRDTDPKGPPFTLNYLLNLSLYVDFGKLSLTSGALQFIKSVPNLSELEITASNGKLCCPSLNICNEKCIFLTEKYFSLLLILYFRGTKMNFGENMESNVDFHIQDEAERLLKEIKLMMKNVVNFELYAGMCLDLERNETFQQHLFRLLGSHSHFQVVIYALESIEYNFPSQFQPSVVLLLK